MMAQFPSKEIAQRSYDFRTLGLGYANIGGLLMNMGLRYDCERAARFAAHLTAIMTGVAYATSAEMAWELGPFPGHKRNAEHMLRVMRNHRNARMATAGLRGLGNQSCCAWISRLPRQRLVEHAANGMGLALKLGKKRIPQRADHCDRADWHHRTGDGLRHHRD